MPRRRHHTAKFRRCVAAVSKARGYNPYAVCMASVKKPFARRGRKMPIKAIRAMLKSPRTPEQLKKYWRKRLKKVV